MKLGDKNEGRSAYIEQLGKDNNNSSNDIYCAIG